MMQANCSCIYCPKHPNHQELRELLYREHMDILGHPKEELLAEVNCFEPDDEDFYEACRDRWDMPGNFLVTIVYGDPNAYVEDFGNNFIGCTSEEYAEAGQ